MGSVLKMMWKDFMGHEETRPSIDYSNVNADMVSRSEWGAEPPTSVIEYEDLHLPLEKAFVRPTNSPECHSRKSCMRAMKKLQERDMDKGMPDIQHNFYIGGDGAIYEGRGWKYMRTPIDDDDLAVNSSISVGAIGQWKVPNKMPPNLMVAAAIYLIKIGMQIGVLRGDCLLQSAFARFTV